MTWADSVTRDAARLARFTVTNWRRLIPRRPRQRRPAAKVVPVFFVAPRLRR